eukprot:COSAG02_NODE_8955_length_2383_cov_1.641419_4_plen_28_part_01
MTDTGHKALMSGVMSAPHALSSALSQGS